MDDGPSSLPDLYRPATITEIAEQAQDYVWDPSKPMSYWRDFVSDALTTSETYEGMEEYELAYIERSRALSVLLERIPSHEDYDDEVPPTSRAYVEETIPRMLDGLDRLAAILLERRDAWWRQQQGRPVTPIPVHQQSGCSRTRCTCPHCVGMLPDSPGSSGSGNGPGYGFSEPVRRVPSPSTWADQDHDGPSYGDDDDIYGEAALARVLEETRGSGDGPGYGFSEPVRRVPSPNAWAEQDLDGPGYGDDDDIYGDAALARVLEETRIQAQSFSRPADTKASASQQTPLNARGLCVVCQDEEANMVVVDCGHLAMCRGCCDQIMADTKECPLCRTHVADGSRLLRVYKT